MGKDIVQIYKISQSQYSTISIKVPVLLYLASQTSSFIELIITSIPSIIDKKQTSSVLFSKNTIQNDLNIANNDNIQSCKTQRKQHYSIPTTSTPNHHAQRISATSVILLNLHTTTKLLLVGKEYMFFQNDGKTAQESKCVKTMIMTNVIDSVISINILEQKLL